MNTARDPLEDALARLDAPPPPADLDARCLATVPQRAVVTKPKGFPTFAWLKSGTSMKRFAFAAAALAAIGFWTTRPVPRKDGTDRAPISSFAQTVDAMRRVTYWRSTVHSVGGWNLRTVWFDARRGLCSNQPHQSGAMVTRDLLLPNGDWYVRQWSKSSGRDKVRLTHMGEEHWRRASSGLLDGIRRPASWANNLGQVPAAPSAQHAGRWKGRPAVVFTFHVPPPEMMRRQGFSTTMRFVIYVDPRTKLMIASQRFSRPPDAPQQGEQLTGQEEWDFSERPDATLFNPNRFLEGADEVQEQNGGPGVTLTPQ